MYERESRRRSFYLHAHEIIVYHAAHTEMTMVGG